MTSVFDDADLWIILVPKCKLARLHVKDYRYDEASLIFHQAWRNRYKLLGPSHTDTLSLFFECAQCWKHLGHLDQELQRTYMHPLSWAVKGNHNDLFEFLIEQDLDFDKKDEYNKRPIYYAAEQNYKAMMKKLLDKGANPNLESCGGTTPLHIAAKLGHHLIVRRLLQGGAEANKPSLEGETALAMATRTGNQRCVEEIESFCAK